MRDTSTTLEPLRSLFISYAHQDNYPVGTLTVIEHLRDALEAANYEVWLDKDDMASRGITMQDEMQKGVSEADQLILAIGGGTVKSKNVSKEIKTALERCIPITPIILNNTFKSIEGENRMLINEIINKNYYIDFSSQQKIDVEKSLAELLAKLEKPLIKPGEILGMDGVVVDTPYLERPQYLNQIIDAIRIDSIQPVVITAHQRTTSVHGMSGIGKSRLAASIVQDCRTREIFPDGIYW